jgi:Protein of unknown function (DUF664)
MQPPVAPLAAILDLNTSLLLTCLAGLSDREAQQRLEAGGNSITFLASHLADSRHFLAQVAFLRRQLGKPPMSYARSDAASSIELLAR